MKLSVLLPAAQIRVPLVARTKEAVLDELLAVLPVDAAQRAPVRECVLARERELSTGIGRGVAIPHGKSTTVARHVCSFGVAADPVEYGAVDGLPCRIFFLCVSNPRDAGEHVRVLSQVARVLNNAAARAALESASTPEEVRRVFLDDEQREGL